jgi:hypothetical protein
MKTLRRFVVVLATVATVGTGAVLALSATSFGAAFLRQAGHNIVVTAQAGLPPTGGGGGGSMTLTVSTSAKLLAKVDAVVHVTYVCDQIFDPFTGSPVPASQLSGNIFVSAQQRVGNSVANGNGSSSVQPACDRTPFFAGTPNQVDVLVTPFGASFKNGTAVAQAFGNVCETGGFFSGGQGPCDSGQSNPTVISIRH